MSKKRNRTKKKNYWQSEAMNSRSYIKNLGLLVSLAVNRFKWEGLPDTCSARFLEYALHRYGIASISFNKEFPDIWQTLTAAPQGTFDAYGIPNRWRAFGLDGTNYEVDDSNGQLCYYSFSSAPFNQNLANPWIALQIYARKLAHYERTEDVNLSHQHKPWLLIASKEKELELVNLYKQIDGAEPAILGNSEISALADEIKAIDTGVPLIVEELARGKQNVLNEALLYLGIPHLAFEKGERMIEDEARANTAPTEIMLLDCLQARREAAEKLNRRFGLDVQVYFNQDIISLNYNYLNNAEARAQDGLEIEQAPRTIEAMKLIQ